MASLHGLKCCEFPGHQTHPYLNVSAKNFFKEHYRAKYKSSLDHVPIHLLHELSPSDSPKYVLKHFMRLGMLVAVPFTDEKTSTGRINDLPIEMQLKHNREGLRSHFLDQTCTQAFCPLSFWLHFCTIVPVFSTVLPYIIKRGLSCVSVCVFISLVYN